MYKIKEKPSDFIVNEISNLDLLDKGNYSVFLLKKKDYTTEKAVSMVCKKLRIGRKLVGYAGNKDKKAITTQYISIKGSKPISLELKDISLEFKGYLNEPICLGDLYGNSFEIKVTTSLKLKKLKRIVNYFGEQRFSKNNAEVGKLIIKKDFKKAVEIVDEGIINSYLEEKPNDFIGALRQIPLKILKLYVHAYQSLIWNKLAESCSDSKTNKKLPLIGFGTEHSKIVDELLKKEDINLREFIIRSIPELSSEGSERDLFVDIEDLEIDLIDKNYNLKFKLKKGSYATEVIRQMFT
jgi:tRNA pseudouridine13 synthase